MIRSTRSWHWYEVWLGLRANEILFGFFGAVVDGSRSCWKGLYFFLVYPSSATQPFVIPRSLTKLKVGSCFSGSATQHGGNETTLFGLMTFLLHMGFTIVGVPPTSKEVMTVSEITGGSPYGSTYISGGDGSRQVSENEKSIARFQGRHVAEVAKSIKQSQKKKKSPRKSKKSEKKTKRESK